MPLDLAAWAQDAVAGSMLLAMPVALMAGLVSFFSPCVVPLLPGYLAFATGLSAADVVAGHRNARRTLLGVMLFIAGFAAVFVTAGIVFGVIGQFLIAYQVGITRGVGVLTIVMGLIFAGVLPLGGRDVRLRRLPTAGVAGAPLLGVVFGLGWTPCLGPTISVVITLTLTDGSAVRGGLLALVYAFGLGIPFLISAVAFTRMATVVELVRRRQQTILRIGGAAMVLLGVLLISGLWGSIAAALRLWAAQFTTVI